MHISKQKIPSLLTRKPALFSLWCFTASFGAYFSMYAFRKPFNSGLYIDGDDTFITSKTFFIIAQVLGYMLSKFIGIKVISELKKNKRIALILGLIFFAETALIFFGLVPNSLKFLFLFLNGLPLGMVWGVIFSFLEGRKVTEFIASGLCVSAIVSSGFLKSLGRYTIETLGVNEYWMPSLIGAFFIPFFLFFVWMLKVIPAPTQQDIAFKQKRVPMTKKERQHTLSKYGLGIGLLILSYAMLSAFRDFRDNFGVEIWQEMSPESSPSIFLQTETYIGIVVVFFMGFLTLFKTNKRGVMVTYTLIGVGFLLIIISTLLFESDVLSPFTWMLLNGTGLYLAYVPFQVVIYEKLIAWIKIRGNAGFFMYMSDSTGYLLSVIILVMSELLEIQLNWLDFIVNLAYFTSAIGAVKLIISLNYFRGKSKKSNPVNASIIKEEWT